MPADRAACDPVSYYNRVGGTDYLYHAFLQFNSLYTEVTLRMGYSTNNGGTWSVCSDPEPNTGYDRPDLAVDTVPGSPCRNTLYVGYDNFPSGTQYMRASNGSIAPFCQSWRGRVSAGQSGTLGSAMVVSTNGRAHNLFSKYASPAGVYHTQSTNCGASWTSSTRIVSYNSSLAEWGIPSTCSRQVYHYPQADSDRGRELPVPQPDLRHLERPQLELHPPRLLQQHHLQHRCLRRGGGAQRPRQPDRLDLDQLQPHRRPHRQLHRRVLPLPHRGPVRRGGLPLVLPHQLRLRRHRPARRTQVHYVVLRSVTGGRRGREWELLQVTAEPTCETAECGGNVAMQWGDYTWNDVVNGVAYPIWTDRRDDADEDNWVGRVCTEPPHWSERGDAPAAPPPQSVSTPTAP